MVVRAALGVRSSDETWNDLWGNLRVMGENFVSDESGKSLNSLTSFGARLFALRVITPIRCYLEG